MPDVTAPFGETLTGRIGIYQQVLGLLDQAAGLSVLSCDPFSGTSRLLAAAAEEARRRCVIVDARRCADTADLAMAIASETVKAFAPEAAAWWQSNRPPSTRAALALSRTLSVEGIDLDGLRLGEGDPVRRVGDALDLTAELAGGQVTVILDHLGAFLWQERKLRARQLLAELRASFQRLPRLDLMLVEWPEGVLSNALADPQHPLYRAGTATQILRARPEQFQEDLIITRPVTRVSPALLFGCADLAAGVPALTWRTVELARNTPRAATAALEGWRALRRLTEPSTGRQWETLRRVHPLAQTIVATTASGLAPHSIAANDKSVNDGLQIMRALGLAWQPKPRSWAIADPLLAAYARDHAQPWVARRRGSAPLPLDDEPGDGLLRAG